MAVGLVSPPHHLTAPSLASCVSDNSRPQFSPAQFESLVLALKETLGPSSGLDSSDVDVETLMSQMRVYDAEERGWVPYAMADPDLPYTRNL